ncbi:uncharacterized protein K02A2.6-like [Bactrocera dorsalis]|uniref:RNA-directed DNA polymerase n=1 Tax=Bactrocera dorsalis TaxID=27457 RepID=A0ABM3JH77_BACDO|nr:uncharacterized protein K02A2.6-like [Bactrocera dorsalis]
MTNDSLIQELVQQRQRFAASLLEQQKQWMQSIQQSIFNADNPNRIKEATVVLPFHAFNKDHQNWESYLEQLSQHFMAYSSKRHVVAARYEFFKREMKHTQTHREWVAELRGIAREYEMIRDQIILNTPHDQVRAAALQKLQPSLEDVLLIAETHETTTKTVATIKENPNSSTMQVNTMQTRKNWKKTTKDNKSAKKGHIAAVCTSNQSRNIRKSTTIPERKGNQNKQENEQYVSTLDAVNIVNGIIEVEANKKCINLEIFNKVIQFQLDSGATVSIINLKTYNILNRPKLQKCTKTLYAFGRQPIPILGELHTKAKCGNKQKRIAVIVANIENANNLFGLDLFKEFGFEITQIDNVVDKGEYIKQIEDLCNKYETVFDNTNAGVIKHFKASIRMQTTAIPKFYKSRQIPFAQILKFREEADRLINTGIWKPVKFGNWASPIILVPKPDGSVRICGDFKVTINSQLDIEQYPLPTRESLLHTIRPGTHFSKLDLKDAYLQMELDEDSKQVMVVNTPLGLFQYQRLPYGIASASAIFQRYLEQLLNGIEGCGNYLDDIIITAPSLQEHVNRVEQVIKILEDNGIKCKKEKCFFLKEEIEYLGRRVSAKGILPDYSGIQAVKQLKPPMNITQLEAFIFSKHLPQMTSHRIQRWAIILMAYQFDIKYRNTHAHGNADALSRLPQNILELLHDGHWGTVRMKQKARHHVWWPNIDDDIANVTRQCEICKVGNPAPIRQYLSWPEAKAPWEGVHIDFAGPIFDSMWLICVDAYSQLPFVTQLSSTTTDNTIHSLKSIFAIEGLPNTLVSDNGPQLTSDAFQQFCKLHGITHITTAPFHPASNGLAERFVQTFKTAVPKNINEGLSVRCAVVKFLTTYRFTPYSNGKTPAELLHGRSVRTMLTQLFEAPAQSKSKVVDKYKFHPNELVYARNFAKGEKWIKGNIIQPIGKMMFLVKSNIGTIRRHINQLKPRSNAKGNNKTPSIILPDQWIPVPESTSTHSIPVML